MTHEAFTYWTYGIGAAVIVSLALWSAYLDITGKP